MSGALHALQLMMPGENSQSNITPAVDNTYQVLDVAELMAQVKGMVQQTMQETVQQTVQ